MSLVISSGTNGRRSHLFRVAMDGPHARRNHLKTMPITSSTKLDALTDPGAYFVG